MDNNTIKKMIYVAAVLIALNFLAVGYWINQVESDVAQVQEVLSTALQYCGKKQ